MAANLELYRIFHTVATQKNISKAANALYVGQPAISRAIRKLEDELGVVLFLRNSRGVTLTEEGQILYRHVSGAMSEIQTGETVLERLKSFQAGEFSLGVSTTLFMHFVLPYVKPFMKRYPDFRLKIVDNDTYSTLRLIESDSIDLGFVSRPFNDKDYDFTPLVEIRDVFIAKRDYLDSLNASGSKEILSRATLFLLEPGNITRQYLDRYLQATGLRLETELETSNMDFLIEMAKLGLGVTHVIRNLVADELTSGSLVEIPLSPPIPSREVGLVTKRGKPLSLAADRFAEFLRTVPPPDQ